MPTKPAAKPATKAKKTAADCQTTWEALSRKVRESSLEWAETQMACRLALTSPQPKKLVAEEFFEQDIYVRRLNLRSASALSSNQRIAVLRDRLDLLNSRHIPQGPFTCNVHAIAKLLGLDIVSLLILRLAVLLHSCPTLNQLCDILCDGSSGFVQCMNFFIEVLQVKHDDFHKALEPSSPLVRCGLIEVESGSFNSSDMISMPAELARQIAIQPDGLDTFIRSFIDSSPTIELAREDFPHHENIWGPLVATLSSARKEGHPAHILISGPPGTGKSQFALALAKDAGMRPALAPCQGSRRQGVAGEARRAALTMAREMFRASGEMALIVDEAENLVDNDPMALLLGRERAPSSSKAWLNQFLEQPGPPMIWIVNSADVLDPSIVRRFTWTIPFQTPPPEVRRRIVGRHLSQSGLSEAFLDEIADRSDLPPYEPARLARVAAHAPAGADRERIVRIALEMTDKFLKRRPAAKVAHGTKFDAALLNVDADLERLVAGLNRRQAGRLGFFGPPGTGKSMLAAEIARQVGKPLVTRIGSNLMDMYVGGTEKNIAAAFEEAAEAGAVLFLDEIDSLAGSRAAADHSWERTGTNEILVQIERFPGIAIVATNHLEILDEALARRLDFKVTFRDLLPRQASKLFLRHAPDASGTLLDRVEALRGLRLGDFGAVLRKFAALEEEITPEAFYEALRTELRFRPNHRERTLGLVKD